MRIPDTYKHIGGYHIERSVKPLPENLRNIIENAEYGVIYFSLGSTVKSKHLPLELKKNLLKMFGNLKQTVLWKLEEDLPNHTKNVHLLKWAPQQSILAHKNVVVFITHGGLLSTTEAVHFGVPIIGVPVFGDQHLNIARAVKKGFARKEVLSESMADDLKKAIEEFLTNPRYQMKVNELSRIYHDRLTTPSQELVHWVEHVIKTQGAPHMRSPALLLPWTQKYYIDLLCVLIVLVLSIKYSVRWLMKSKIEEIEKKLN